MRILLAGATGVIGRQAVPVLAAAGHEVVGLARTPARLPDAEAVAADALDPAAVQRAVLAVAPDVIVHMLTAIPGPATQAPGPRHGPDQPAAHPGHGQPARRRRRCAGHRPGGRLRLRPRRFPGQVRGRAPVAGLADPVRPRRGRRAEHGAPGHRGRRAGAAAGPPLRPGLQLRPRRRRPHPAARGALNVVDDQPTLVHDWLPEMAAMLGAPAPRHVPAWLARVLVGGWGVAYMTGLAGASNAHARHLLDWKPTYTSWRAGLTADLDTRAPR